MWPDLAFGSRLDRAGPHRYTSETARRCDQVLTGIDSGEGENSPGQPPDDGLRCASGRGFDAHAHRNPVLDLVEVLGQAVADVAVAAIFGHGFGDAGGEFGAVL